MNIYLLLVGVQISIVIVEIILEIPQKFKMELPCHPPLCLDPGRFTVELYSFFKEFSTTKLKECSQILPTNIYCSNIKMTGGHINPKSYTNIPKDY